MSTGTRDKLLPFPLYTGAHVRSFVPLHSASLGETLLGCYLPCVPGTLAFSIYVSTGKKKEEAYGQGTLKDSCSGNEHPALINWFNLQYFNLALKS